MDTASLSGAIRGTDRSGVLAFRFLLNGPDRDRVRMTMTSLVGKPPADVLPAVQLVADLVPATGLDRGADDLEDPLPEQSD
ncbi:hypothetical protein ITP53_28715 [Nonomuraea sp. K274]|uniref:Uncharacterized protein n=1 Tax=Nonomuraea cypriaca TaxID=1187855 RepID=A0A931AB96_9ACTN|nr:hypothetical protein [Nonomuraea cypriaca]MBF8189646.1 hypothetical protein [Nonomuraea cypriaca]